MKQRRGWSRRKCSVSFSRDVLLISFENVHLWRRQLAPLPTARSGGTTYMVNRKLDAEHPISYD